MGRFLDLAERALAVADVDIRESQPASDARLNVLEPDDATSAIAEVCSLVADRTGPYPLGAHGMSKARIWSGYEAEVDAACLVDDMPRLYEALDRWREGVACYCLPAHIAPCAPGCLLNWCDELGDIIERAGPDA